MEILPLLPKRSENLKEVQRVLDLPELKIVKPSDTRWLAHEKCIKVVKANYAAIVITLDNIYKQTHELNHWGSAKFYLKSVLCQLCIFLTLHFHKLRS